MNNASSKILLETLQGKKAGRSAFWFMRQAGRYLPEYRELRSKAADFMEFCLTPSLACEVTLQPIRRFGMDGAIIFSDILVIPHALGIEVRFEEGRGPVLPPVTSKEAYEALSMDWGRLSPVYEALRWTRLALPPQTTLIGFAGAPWTLACYMVQGGSDKNFKQVRDLAVRKPEFFLPMLDSLAEWIALHLIRQIEAGAEAVQLFDSWAGVPDEKEFENYVIAPTEKIIKAVKSACPDTPIIGFPRLAGEKYRDYVSRTRVDAVSIDTEVPVEWARRELGEKCVVQGNLDPQLLAQDQDAMLRQAEHIISIFRDKAFVFNLGHGILPHTPVGNMQALCDFLRGHALTA